MIMINNCVCSSMWLSESKPSTLSSSLTLLMFVSWSAYTFDKSSYAKEFIFHARAENWQACKFFLQTGLNKLLLLYFNMLPQRKCANMAIKVLLDAN